MCAMPAMLPWRPLQALRPPFWHVPHVVLDLAARGSQEAAQHARQAVFRQPLGFRSARPARRLVCPAMHRKRPARQLLTWCAQNVRLTHSRQTGSSAWHVGTAKLAAGLQTRAHAKRTLSVQRAGQAAILTMQVVNLAHSAQLVPARMLSSSPALRNETRCAALVQWARPFRSTSVFLVHSARMDREWQAPALCSPTHSARLTHVLQKHGA